MSDLEEENLCFFGKPLEPYDEDSIPKRRPITIEEQVAKDAQGRRRFHGAFTGGFSAGFFNTVGSLEGWQPSEFKSSRQEKAENKQQKPEDFMDDEDVGEFGIAPLIVRATEEFAKSKKRKKQPFPQGIIPGQPVLQTLIESGNETIGYLLLKNISLKDKINAIEEETTKIYGCEMPKTYEIKQSFENEDILHDIYRTFLESPKTNTFGMGHIGLEEGHVNLFKSTNLVVSERNNKKLSISGQAFGVGAFEEDDEDIYVKDDLSNYDFELTSEKAKKKKEVQNKNLLYDHFILSKTNLAYNETYPPPVIPHSFTGKHKIKKSRFEPLAEEKIEVKRKEVDPLVRAKQLGENYQEKHTVSGQQHKNIQKSAKNTQSSKPSGLVFDRFVAASEPEDILKILEPVKKTHTDHGTQEMRDAAKMKMFGPLTRVWLSWQPSSLLCKRFNVPEPLYNENYSKNEKKKTKHLIFEYAKVIEDESVPKAGLAASKNIMEARDESGKIANETIKGDSAPQTANLETIECDTTPQKSNLETIERGATPQTPNLETIEHDATPQTPNLETMERDTMSQTSNLETIDLDTTPQTASLETTNKGSQLEQSLKATQVLDATDKVDVSKNVDLFKAIFLSSSSESENEEEEEETRKEDEDRKEQMKSNMLSDLIPKIKPIKQGILSGVNFHKFSLNKPPTDSESSNNPQSLAENNKTDQKELAQETDQSKKESEDLYGPKLPAQLPKTTITNPIFPTSSQVSDEWIEKEKLNIIKKSHKQKKDKKQKKHKKKHKKHDK